MRMWRAAAAGLAAAALANGSASAQTYTFGYTGTIVTWTAAASGQYFVEAIGAQGASGGAFAGGRGAQIGGEFTFTAGTLLQLAVGGMGSGGLGNGGGGGGSFVVDAFDQALLVAGGGGGIRTSACANGQDASITAYAYTGSGSSCGPTGILKTSGLGQGGIISAYSYGSGGAGFFSDGVVDNGFTTVSGRSWANGLFGGAAGSCGAGAGGFGGGGSGAGCYGGGGGGGYSGGDGGRAAGGGGSWNIGTNQIANAGVGYGNGSIRITFLGDVEEPVVTPEPVTMTLLGTGLAGVAAARRRRRQNS